MAQANADARDHFTFGAGRRSCPGTHIAHNSLFINIARIFWAFDIRKSVDGEGNVVEPSTDALPGFLLTPVKFACRFEARSRNHKRIIEKVWIDAQREGLVWGRDKPSRRRKAKAENGSVV